MYSFTTIISMTSRTDLMYSCTTIISMASRRDVMYCCTSIISMDSRTVILLSCKTIRSIASRTDILYSCTSILSMAAVQHVHVKSLIHFIHLNSFVYVPFIDLGKFSELILICPPSGDYSLTLWHSIYSRMPLASHVPTDWVIELLFKLGSRTTL